MKVLGFLLLTIVVWVEATTPITGRYKEKSVKPKGGGKYQLKAKCIYKFDNVLAGNATFRIAFDTVTWTFQSISGIVEIDKVGNNYTVETMGDLIPTLGKWSPSFSVKYKATTVPTGHCSELSFSSDTTTSTTTTTTTTTTASAQAVSSSQHSTAQQPTTQPPSTQPPSTQPPSTQSPSTQPPSTQPPSTQPPSTQLPSTQPSSTQSPSTQPPSTQPPSTQPPSTQPPSTQPPSTQPPSTQPPSTQQPSTQPPSTQPPSTQPPSTQPPSTQPPSTQQHSTQPPSTQPPSIQQPSTQPPSTQPPSTQHPSTQPPSTQPPSTQPPSTQPPSTQPPSTQPPSTQPPSTQPPSTQPPSTQPPSTQLPSTQPPSTQPPSTQPPSTQPPSTQPPSTQPPSTQQPSTQPPSTQPPSTQPPSTQPPSTQPPSTQPPSTQPPSTQPPSTQPPSTQPPSTQLPSTQPPSTQPPSTQPPSTQPPSTQPPSTQPPSTQPPSTQPPSTQPPSTQLPSTQPPSTQPPSTQPPSTQPPSTQPPSTQPPSTQPPSTQPPSTQPPSTQLPSTQPPSTQPPSTQRPSTQPPSTQPPSTQPPSTQPPSTQPPSTQLPSTQPPSTQPPSTQPPSTQPPSTQPPSTQPPSTQPPFTQPLSTQTPSSSIIIGSTNNYGSTNYPSSSNNPGSTNNYGSTNYPSSSNNPGSTGNNYQSSPTSAHQIPNLPFVFPAIPVSAWPVAGGIRVEAKCVFDVVTQLPPQGVNIVIDFGTQVFDVQLRDVVKVYPVVNVGQTFHVMNSNWLQSGALEIYFQATVDSTYTSDIICKGDLPSSTGISSFPPHSTYPTMPSFTGTQYPSSPPYSGTTDPSSVYPVPQWMAVPIIIGNDWQSTGDTRRIHGFCMFDIPVFVDLGQLKVNVTFDRQTSDLLDLGWTGDLSIGQGLWYPRTNTVPHPAGPVTYDMEVSYQGSIPPKGMCLVKYPGTLHYSSSISFPSQPSTNPIGSSGPSQTWSPYWKSSTPPSPHSLPKLPHMFPAVPVSAWPVVGGIRVEAKCVYEVHAQLPPQGVNFVIDFGTHVFDAQFHGVDQVYPLDNSGHAFHVVNSNWLQTGTLEIYFAATLDLSYTPTVLCEGDLPPSAGISSFPPYSTYPTMPSFTGTQYPPSPPNSGTTDPSSVYPVPQWMAVPIIIGNDWQSTGDTRRIHGFCMFDIPVFVDLGQLKVNVTFDRQTSDLLDLGWTGDLSIGQGLWYPRTNTVPHPAGPVTYDMEVSYQGSIPPKGMCLVKYPGALHYSSPISFPSQPSTNPIGSSGPSQTWSPYWKSSTPPSPQSLPKLAYVFPAVPVSAWPVVGGIRVEAKCVYEVYAQLPPLGANFVIDFGTHVFDAQFQDVSQIYPLDNFGHAFHVVNNNWLQTGTLEVHFLATLDLSYTPTVLCKGDLPPSAGMSSFPSYPTYPTMPSISGTLYPTLPPNSGTMDPSSVPPAPKWIAAPINIVNDWPITGDIRGFHGNCMFDIPVDLDVGQLKLNVTFDKPTAKFMDIDWAGDLLAGKGVWYPRSNTIPHPAGPVMYDMEATYQGLVPPLGLCLADFSTVYQNPSTNPSPTGFPYVT